MNEPRGLPFHEARATTAYRELMPGFVVGHEAEFAQLWRHMTGPGGERLDRSVQADRLLSHRFLGADPTTSGPAAP